MESGKKTIIMVNHYGAQAKYIGFARYSNWGNYLVSKGYEVFIICDANIHNSNICMVGENEEYKKVEENGVKYVYVKTPKYSGNGMARVRNLVGFYFASNRMLKKLPKAYVVIAQTPSPLACLSALQFCRKKNTPCICDVVDLWPESIVVYKKISRKRMIIKMLYNLERWIYKKCDALIFSMAGGYQYIVDRGWNDQVKKGKIFYINTGVDVRDFDLQKKTRKYNDPKLYDEQLFKVVYSGSVRLVNGIKLLCDAGKIIKEKGFNNIFIMIHGGGDYVDELSEYCEKNEITNVKLYGHIEKNDIPPVLSNADLCVLCYQYTPILRYGGSMNKMFDYFASGKPVITNAKMGYSIIEEFQCGTELGTSNPEVLASEIIRFSQMSLGEREEYGKNSRRAAEAYDIPKLGEKLVTVIEYAKKNKRL